MLADNGVYILATKGPKGKKEYRVSHEQAIENLWYEPDFPKERPELSLEYVSKIFGDCRVFNDRKLAEGYALCVLDRVGYAEYGIQLLYFAHIRLPKFVLKKPQCEVRLVRRSLYPSAQ
ncbi:hypothetical protein A2661_01440 [Candidatus Giovannonibacteria bacterium RIFCSPHIGHO2_01_FULL_45_24]|uniref:Uncharacterized protein n=1 Tax=Candidatus Giovannonibacteria bacterium RIFCSPLOWO2_01_FULL_46_32 TaxID=1798353 RepID=A0A1F5XH24_9BACT|nr:MAG: hypothetical protein A2661_01440 [Candidatus Giovannonibacteria bacterium RIFCSPHIGHO2_01_FULL_45_24]OGF87234.1 MAG: hypothetical protein A3B19_03310 [Candidatus Giovannonibacteria bacterium RIFCSPLOWO2_01_FULL_46_32]